MKSSRRKFLGNVSTVCLSSWLMLESAFEGTQCQPAGDEPEDAYGHANEKAIQCDAERDGYLELEMESGRLEQLHGFYSKTIGWETELSDDELTVVTGRTKIHFRKAKDPDSQPFYHIAWSISSGKFDQAKRWLQKRVALLKAEDGRDEIQMRGNRRGLYFEDPSHNVLELIARGNVNDDSNGPFKLADIKSVNHFGIVVDDVFQHIKQIQERVDLPNFGEPNAEFARIGNELRHLVLVPEGRLWFPERKRKAIAYPATLIVPGERDEQVENEKLGYSVSTRMVE